jgi:hypothetical protein
LYIKTAKKLKDSDRRQFMAEVVKGLGIGGQILAERELEWNRRTIRKGIEKLRSGQTLFFTFFICFSFSIISFSIAVTNYLLPIIARESAFRLC